MKNYLYYCLLLFFTTNLAFSQGETRSNYWVLGGLNTAPLPRGGNVYGGLGPVLRINKQYDDSVIEVTVNTTAKVENFSRGVRTASFQVRIDGNHSTISNNVPIQKEEGTGNISIFAVFRNLPAGNHEIQIYAKTIPSGNMWVTLDPGGYGGRIIAKETF